VQKGTQDIRQAHNQTTTLQYRRRVKERRILLFLVCSRLPTEGYQHNEVQVYKIWILSECRRRQIRTSLCA